MSKVLMAVCADDYGEKLWYVAKDLRRSYPTRDDFWSEDAADAYQFDDKTQLDRCCTHLEPLLTPYRIRVEDH
jgi:hypothetical protein